MPTPVWQCLLQTTPMSSLKSYNRPNRWELCSSPFHRWHSQLWRTETPAWMKVCKGWHWGSLHILKAGPPSGWGMRGRILHWSPRLPTPLALTPALEYGWDLWIWWNSTPTTRLPIIYPWVDQKEHYPGWVWPNQGSLSKEMKHLENFRKYTAMLWTVWWKGRPLGGPWDPWDLVLRPQRMVSADNLKELRRWPWATTWHGPWPTPGVQPGENLSREPGKNVMDSWPTGTVT